MQRRFPKFGASKARFNNATHFVPLSLGQIAYHIEKGNIDASKPIDMKGLLEARVVSKVRDGVKILGNGADRFKELGVTLNIEVADATTQAIETIQQTGGSLSVKYRTPLLMQYHLRPHKFFDRNEPKTPMPHNKAIKKLERLKRKGLSVSYPSAPWLTDNYDEVMEERAEKKRRMKSAQHAELLPVYPVPRIPHMSLDKPRLGRDHIQNKFHFKLNN